MSLRSHKRRPRPPPGQGDVSNGLQGDPVCPRALVVLPLGHDRAELVFPEGVPCHDFALFGELVMQGFCCPAHRTGVLLSEDVLEVYEEALLPVRVVGDLGLPALVGAALRLELPIGRPGSFSGLLHELAHPGFVFLFAFAEDCFPGATSLGPRRRDLCLSAELLQVNTFAVSR